MSIVLPHNFITAEEVMTIDTNKTERVRPTSGILPERWTIEWTTISEPSLLIGWTEDWHVVLTGYGAYLKYREIRKNKKRNNNKKWQ